MSRILNPCILTDSDMTEYWLNCNYLERIKLSEKGYTTRDAQVEYILDRYPDGVWKQDSQQ